MLDRTVEQGLLDVLIEEGIGSIVFSPLAQGLLTNRYLKGIPRDARAVRDPRFLKPEHITEEQLARTRKLDGIARRRSQSLAQMALAWVLRQPAVTSALVGASRPDQLEDNLGAIRNTRFSDEELREIDGILSEE